MALRMIEHARAVFHAAGLRILRSVVQPRDPCRGNRAGTHRTWFKRHVEGGTVETHRPGGRTCRSYSQDFRVCRRVTQFATPVSRCGENLAVARGNHRTDGNFSPVGRTPRFRQRDVHETGVLQLAHSPDRIAIHHSRTSTIACNPDPSSAVNGGTLRSTACSIGSKVRQVARVPIGLDARCPMIYGQPEAPLRDRALWRIEIFATNTPPSAGPGVPPGKLPGMHLAAVPMHGAVPRAAAPPAGPNRLDRCGITPDTPGPE